jgi:tetratricopeptide (TPR) repeat protein
MYDPDLPMMRIEKDFDRAHNSLIQILIDSGVFALIFYLVFLISLLWGLQKIKETYPIAHALQTGFIAYFIASLASIEAFASMLIFFFLSGYSIHLILLSLKIEDTKIITKLNNESGFIKFLKGTGLSILGLFLIIFLWQYNFVPFQMNKQINVAQSLEKEEWEYSLKILEEQSKIKTFFLPFTNSIYIDSLVNRIIAHPEETIVLSKTLAEIAKNNTELQPYNYQNWLRLGESLTTLAKEENNPILFKEAQNAFEKALELSPKNPNVVLGSFMNKISSKDFKKSEEESVTCLQKYPKNAECLWMSGLINIYLNNIKGGKDFIEEAKEKGYLTENEISLNQLAIAYFENKNYREMIPIYQKLSIESIKVEYKKNLMLIYREAGEYGKAKQLALETIKTNPELKLEIEAFLRSF